MDVSGKPDLALNVLTLEAAAIAGFPLTPEVLLVRSSVDGRSLVHKPWDP